MNPAAVIGSHMFKVIGEGVDGIAGLIRLPSALAARVTASWGGGWDHVSVSLINRCPSWEEMEFIRAVCFLDDETVVQFSVPRVNHINIHPHVLHLWRKQGEGQWVELPPSWMV